MDDWLNACAGLSATTCPICLPLLRLVDLASHSASSQVWQHATVTHPRPCALIRVCVALAFDVLRPYLVAVSHTHSTADSEHTHEHTDEHTQYRLFDQSTHESLMTAAEQNCLDNAILSRCDRLDLKRLFIAQQPGSEKHVMVELKQAEVLERLFPSTSTPECECPLCCFALVIVLVRVHFVCVQLC